MLTTACEQLLLMNHFAQRNECCPDVKDNVLNEQMASRNVAVGLMFLSQVVVGILGNISLLYHLVLSCNEYTLRSTDVILRHLIVANALVILSKGIPQTIAAFWIKYFFNDLGCKLILYIQQVGSSVSTGITCLLSIYQNITINPMNSFWKDLKGKAPKYIGFSISLLYPLYGGEFHFSSFVLGKWNSENTTEKRDCGYFSTVGHDKMTDSLYTALVEFTEVIFSLLQIWSSGSMVLTLGRNPSSWLIAVNVSSV